jgi:hypothetical protein
VAVGISSIKLTSVDDDVLVGLGVSAHAGDGGLNCA